MRRILGHFLFLKSVRWGYCYLKSRLIYLFRVSPYVLLAEWLVPWITVTVLQVGYPVVVILVIFAEPYSSSF